MPNSLGRTHGYAIKHSRPGLKGGARHKVGWLRKKSPRLLEAGGKTTKALRLKPPRSELAVYTDLDRARDDVHRAGAVRLIGVTLRSFLLHVVQRQVERRGRVYPVCEARIHHG